jgi:surface antigen
MRSSSSGLASLFITIFAGFFLAAAVLLGADPGLAQAQSDSVGAVELPPAGRGNGAPATQGGTSCTCPGNSQPPATGSTPTDQLPRERLWPRPSLAELKETLDDSDAIATLEAVQMALTEVGDGATYVWRRRHGRLSGVIQPTSSFKDANGLICRHIVMALTSGSYSRKTEGIACRQRSGVWILEG